jgi:hypothetical protein
MTDERRFARFPEHQSAEEVSREHLSLRTNTRHFERSEKSPRNWIEISPYSRND